MTMTDVDDILSTLILEHDTPQMTEGYKRNRSKYVSHHAAQHNHHPQKCKMEIQGDCLSR